MQQVETHLLPGQESWVDILPGQCDFLGKFLTFSCLRFFFCEIAYGVVVRMGSDYVFVSTLKISKSPDFR